MVEHVPFRLDVDRGFQWLSVHHVVGIGVVIIVVTIAASAFLLCLALFGFDFLIAALRELVLLLEPPLKALGGGLPSTRQREESSSAAREERKESSLEKSKIKSEGLLERFWFWLLKLVRVQSTIQPSLSKQEKG